jgi:hypothetical protein
MAMDWLEACVALAALMLLVIGVPYGICFVWRACRRRRLQRRRLDRRLHEIGIRHCLGRRYERPD